MSLSTIRDKAAVPPDQSCRKSWPVIKQVHCSSGVTIGGQFGYDAYHYPPNCS